MAASERICAAPLGNGRLSLDLWLQGFSGDKTWQSNANVQQFVGELSLGELPIAMLGQSAEGSTNSSEWHSFAVQGNSERRFPSFRESHFAKISEETSGGLRLTWIILDLKQVVSDVMRNLISNHSISFQSAAEAWSSGEVHLGSAGQTCPVQCNEVSSRNCGT